MTLKKLSWLLAFVYILYIFLARIPELSTLAIFSAVAAYLFLVFVYLFHSYANLGPRRATLFLLLAYAISFFFEFLGVNTGFPFGRYAYTGSLGAALGGVPLLIPFLWASLGYFCMIATKREYIVPSLLLVIIDVFIDPRYSMTLWHWVGPTQFYGVPLSNFLGWFITSMVFFSAYQLFAKKGFGSGKALLFYYLVGVQSAVADVQAGLWQVALIALVLLTFATIMVLRDNEGLFAR